MALSKNLAKTVARATIVETKGPEEEEEEIKIVPYLPFWARPGCAVLKVWDSPIKSGPATGVATWVRYRTKKGSIIEDIKWVKWKV